MRAVVVNYSTYIIVVLYYSVHAALQPTPPLPPSPRRTPPSHTPHRLPPSRIIHGPLFIPQLSLSLFPASTRLRPAWRRSPCRARAPCSQGCPAWPDVSGCPLRRVPGVARAHGVLHHTRAPPPPRPALPALLRVPKKSGPRPRATPSPRLRLRARSLFPARTACRPAQER